MNDFECRYFWVESPAERVMNLLNKELTKISSTVYYTIRIQEPIDNNMSLTVGFKRDEQVRK